MPFMTYPLCHKLSYLHEKWISNPVEGFAFPVGLLETIGTFNNSESVVLPGLHDVLWKDKETSLAKKLRFIIQ